MFTFSFTMHLLMFDFTSNLSFISLGILFLIQYKVYYFFALTRDDDQNLLNTTLCGSAQIIWLFLISPTNFVFFKFNILISELCALAFLMSKHLLIIPWTLHTNFNSKLTRTLQGSQNKNNHNASQNAKASHFILESIFYRFPLFLL